MKNLNRYMPAFAADYTGASEVVYEMDGMVIVFDGRSCACHATISDEPRFMVGPKLAFSTNIKEVEAITGNDEKQIQKIINAVNQFPVKLVTLLGSPVPTIVGTDLDALAHIVESRTGIPCVGISTTGFDSYDKGASKAFLKLIKKFTGKAYFTPKPCEVNVFGTLGCDMWDVDSVHELERAILDCGAESVTCWGADCVLEEISGADQSKLNIVVSASGVKAAEYMKEKYGIPYLAGCPVGERAMERFKADVRSLLGTEEPTQEKEEAKCKQACNYKKILVIGEQMLANGIRSCLMDEFAAEQVDCVTFFEQYANWKQEEDKKLRDEESLKSYVAQRGPYDLIIGDPVFKELVAGGTQAYMDWPQLAVSSVIHMQKSFQSLGSYGTVYFAHALQTGEF